MWYSERGNSHSPCVPSRSRGEAPSLLTACRSDRGARMPLQRASTAGKSGTAPATVLHWALTVWTLLSVFSGVSAADNFQAVPAQGVADLFTLLQTDQMYFNISIQGTSFSHIYIARDILIAQEEQACTHQRCACSSNLGQPCRGGKPMSKAASRSCPILL